MFIIRNIYFIEKSSAWILLVKFEQLSKKSRKTKLELDFRHTN